MPVPDDAERLVVGGIGAWVELRVTGKRRAEAVEVLRRQWSRSLSNLPSAVARSPLRQGQGDPTSPHRFGPPTATMVLDSDLLPPALSAEAAHDLWEETSRRVTLALIEARAGELLMFHAGALCHPDTGRSLVFVAPSQTGKTTLAATLGTRFGYLSDELVAVDGIRVLAYPKPLSVRDPGGGPRRELSPDDLGLLPAHPSPTLARLVVLARDPVHVGAPRVEELDLFDAIVELAPQMSSLGAMDRGLHRLADVVERTGPVLRLTYADGESLLPVVEELLT